MREGLITPTQLDAALRMQQSYGGRLASTLVELGYLDGDVATRALAKLRNVPAALQKHFDSAERSVLAKVPKRVVEKYLAVPLGWATEGTLICAMVEPSDMLALEELRFLTGAKVVPGIALDLRVRNALERWYGTAPRREHGFVAMGGAEGLRELDVEETGHVVAPSHAPPPFEAYRGVSGTPDLTLDAPPPNPSTVATEPPPPANPPAFRAPELTLDSAPPRPPPTPAPARPLVPPSRPPSSVPRRTHPPPLRRDDPDEQPRPSMRPPHPVAQVLSLQAAVEGIATASSFEQRIELLLAWLRGAFEAGVVFEVRNDIAFSSHAFGPAVRSQAPPRIAVPLTQPSMLVLPYEARTTFFGTPTAEGSELHARVWSALGTQPPREALALPIVIADKVYAIVYAHPRKGERIPPSTLVEVANLCGAIARSG